jgi:citrate lyase subunit beta/citryl-CoA lyase
VASLAFGEADFLADIQAPPSHLVDAALLARMQMVLESRSAGVGRPVDGVFTSLEDSDGLRRSAQRARALGFFGKSVIHPRQIEIVNDIFTPKDEEVEDARHLITAYERAESEGTAALRVDDHFVDPAVVRRARALVKLAAEVSRGH